MVGSLEISESNRMFMSSGHWQNTGLAKWISDNLYQYNTSDEKSMNPMKWHSIQSGGNLSDTRETINGFPCRLILINDGETPLNEGQNEPTPGNVKDMGIFNFNNDKGNTDTFGLDNSIFPRCVSYEVVANSDTSAGAFVPMEKRYSLGTPDSDCTAQYRTTGNIYLSDLPALPWNITLLSRRFQIRGDKFLLSIPTDTAVSSLVNNDGNTLDYVQFRISDVDNGENLKFTINGNYYEFDRYATTESSTVEPIICLTTEEAELAYLQDSFELRYPDNKEVGADYGMLGMMGEEYVVDYHVAGEGTIYWSTKIEHDYFGSNELTVSDNVSDVILYYPSTAIIVAQKVNGKVNIETSSEYPYIAIRWKAPFDSCTVNGIKLHPGEQVPDETVIKNPETRTIMSSNYGLKRVIDWVGNATNEEFVANFEQYFNKEYTFRYYLLVIALGMVDNLGGRSCRV